MLTYTIENDDGLYYIMTSSDIGQNAVTAKKAGYIDYFAIEFHYTYTYTNTYIREIALYLLYFIHVLNICDIYIIYVL